ncbi:MAG: hypothetical protein ACRERU_01350 [Methylococcales bacterium]
MADFAIWVTAAESSLKWQAGEFLGVYNRMQHDAVIDGIEASPVGSMILAEMNYRDEWVTTPSNLLNHLTEKAGNQARSIAWPKTEKGLWNILKRLAPGFRSMNIVIGKVRTKTGRLYKFTKVGRQASQASPDAEKHPQPSNDVASSDFFDNGDACDALKPIPHELLKDSEVI